MADPTSERDFLRHTLATLAYRSGKALRGASPEFAEYRVGSDSRTPGQILSHMGDLMDWASNLAEGRHVWKPARSDSWESEVDRFFTGLEALDRRLADPEPTGFPLERLFQGPIADALSHTGQIAMLRRLAGEPIRGENYFKAEIAIGRVGPDQAEPVYEFD